MKSILRISMILLIGLMCTNLLLAQDSTLHAQPTFIKLNGETEVREIIIPLRDSLNSVNILIKSSIKAGELTIEIFDPTGEKFGDFSLGYHMNNNVSQNNLKKKVTARDLDDSEDKAFGSLFRSLKNPKKGAWKARITNKGAVGNIMIQFTKQTTVFIKVE